MPHHEMLPGLIVNADDLGIHPDINAGILSAYRKGILTSCTMLMTTAYLEETVRDFVRPKALPIGLHLSLTLGRALAPVNEVPDLVDEDGNLQLSAAKVLLRSYKSATGQAVLQQIRREFEAQLACARDYGLQPTHADSHQHVHMTPAIFSLLEEILPRFGIHRLRFSREPFWRFAMGGDILPIAQRGNLAKWALLRWRSSQIERHLASNDSLFGVLYSGVVNEEPLLALIDSVADNCSTEICIHPGFPASRDVPYYPRMAYNDFISSDARQIEHDVLIGERAKSALQRRRITLRAFDGRAKAELM